MDNEFIELPNGRLVCYNHHLVVCNKCCVDYSFAVFIELPNGRLVCYNHHLVVCNKCRVDYSFAGSDSSEPDEDDDDEGSLIDASNTWKSLAFLAFADKLKKAEAEWQESTENASKRPSKIIADQGAKESDLVTLLASLKCEEITPGTGRVFSTKFDPPSPTSTPASVFKGVATYANWTRFIHCQDEQKILIFTDGACLNNGQPDARAGWAFVHGPRKPSDASNNSARIASGRLENKGPYGGQGGQTSNRAELRAVIAALCFRNWVGESYLPGRSFKSLVIATDSEYVVEGATTWARQWMRKGWRTRAGSQVKNKDLWLCLLGQVERYAVEGMRIEFWRIPREQNGTADAAAKAAAAEQTTEDEFRTVYGISG